MEENVALDSNKQKQFVKSIKGIKKLIKKSDKDGAAGKFLKTKAKGGKVQKQKRQPRGLVYLGHIPHGFYESEMTQYFKQFGVVTNVRVIRSARTGHSKGHAFVEFKDPDVAEVVAETMNNYLMGKRLIKAASIPPEKQRRFAQRKNWNAIHNPTNEMRIKMRKAYNTNKDEAVEIKQAKRLLLNFRKTKKKLNDLGINYDIFSPVDVPEVLTELLAKPEVKQEKTETKIENKDQSKKNIKEEQKKQAKVNKKDGKINKIDEKINKKDKKINKKEEKINKKEEKNNKKKEITNKKEEKINKKEEKINKKGEKLNKKGEMLNKQDEKISQQKGPVKAEKVKSSEKETKITAAVKNEQKLKEEKLKVAGVKSVENFIKINKKTSDAESDSDYEFDSDEFDKMLENEADNDSESETADGNAEDEESENNDSEESEEDEVPAPKRKMTTKTTKNKAPQQVVKQQSPQKIKRKAIEKPVTVSKKSKFENRNTQKLNKKQFKKRK